MALSLFAQALFASLLSNLTSNNPGDMTVPSSTASVPTVVNAYTVQTVYGMLMGREYHSKNGTTLRVFLGIPYATSPTGSLRFQAPQPPTKWFGVRNATKFGNECMQDQNVEIRKMEGFIPPASEDCLYLNVYAPNNAQDKSNSLLPVMVWIHGGGFLSGSGSAYDGSDLASGKGVVVVTINYRLNIFGFLSTEDSSAPGNYGMLDQILALKWVKNNIRAFGGDPNLVTIFGQSAGASSVSLLILSPLSAGLFQRAIMQSGSSLSPFSISHSATRFTPKMTTSLIGNSVGCRGRDSSLSLVQCLQSIDAETLLNESQALPSLSGVSLNFEPRVERDFGFLPDLPYSLLSTGRFNKVDSICGFNRVELPLNDPQNKGIDYSVFKETVSNYINRNYAVVDDQILYDKVKDLYRVKNTTGDITTTTQDRIFLRDQLQTIGRDFYFANAAFLEATLKLKSYPQSKTFVYDFTYYSSGYKYPSWSGPFHGAELPFVFGDSLRIYAYSGASNSQDRQVGDLVQTLWTNFAKYGDPSKSASGNDKWVPFSDASPTYYNINLPPRTKVFNGKSRMDWYRDYLFRLDYYGGTTVVG